MSISIARGEEMIYIYAFSPHGEKDSCEFQAGKQKCKDKEYTCTESKY